MIGISTCRKGSKNVVLTRERAEFIIEDRVSIGLQNWLKDTLIPDEHFYSTIDSIKSYEQDPAVIMT